VHPTVGRIVHYRMSQVDVRAVRTQLRANPTALLDQSNLPQARQSYAAVVTSVTGQPGHPLVNLKVFLDGPFDYFAASRVEGDEAGTWCWPPREGG
jgi:hypothetical protein